MDFDASVMEEDRRTTRSTQGSSGSSPTSARAPVLQPGDDRGDIDDTRSEFTAHTWGDADLGKAVTQVHVEEVPRDWNSRGWRPVYWAKGWSAWRA